MELECRCCHLRTYWLWTKDLRQHLLPSPKSCHGQFLRIDLIHQIRKRLDEVFRAWWSCMWAGDRAGRSVRRGDVRWGRHRLLPVQVGGVR